MKETLSDMDAQEKKKIFEDLKRSIKIIYEMVSNKPCDELMISTAFLRLFYEKNMITPKLKELHP